MKERFPNEATWAGRVRPEDLTPEERVQIKDGRLGYCEGHKVLYRKPWLTSCFIPSVLLDVETACQEWPSGPKEWSPRVRQ